MTVSALLVACGDDMPKVELPDIDTSNPLLATLCGGVFIGGAIGLVVKNEASTGGMDIPPLVLNKKLGIPISVAMYGFDCIILLMQTFYTDIEYVLYGLFLVLCYTFVLDKTLLIGKKQIQVLIVSKEYELIKQAIIQETRLKPI